MAGALHAFVEQRYRARIGWNHTRIGCIEPNPVAIERR